MKIVSIIIISSLALPAFADRKGFQGPSPEIKAAIAAEATKQGYDLSTEEGRKSFGDYIKAQRDKQATELGVDLTTAEGRKQLQEANKAKMDALAKEQGFDLSTKEGRSSMDKYLIESGNLALVPGVGPRPPRPNEGPRPSERPQQGGEQAGSQRQNFEGRGNGGPNQQGDHRPANRPPRPSDSGAPTEGAAGAGGDQKRPPRPPPPPPPQESSSAG